MVSVLAAVALALAVPVATGRSPMRLVRRGWRWLPIGAAGLLGQVVLAAGVVPADRGPDVGAGLLVASLLLLAGFAAANLVRTGMGVVLLGLVSLLTVVALNHGMPVDVPAGADRTEAPYAPTATHRPQGADDRLIVLTDLVTVTDPVPLSLSFGVLVLAVGLVDVAFHASRRARRVAGPPAVAVPAPPDGAPPTAATNGTHRPRRDPARRPAPADLVRPVPRAPTEAVPVREQPAPLPHR